MRQVRPSLGYAGAQMDEVLYALFCASDPDLERRTGSGLHEMQSRFLSAGGRLQARGASFSGPGDSKSEAQSQPGKTIINCSHCRGRMRIPVFLHKRIHVTCPHCGEKFDVKLD